MELQGRLEVSDVRMVESEAMGYTVCAEHGIDHIINGQTVNLTHRATNIFRQATDGWRLAHHHTDASSG
jgi:ketosteroid isomerase-like protein